MLMADKEELRSVVTDYLRNHGYMTGGFMGDGPVRVEFIREMADEQPVVVGVRQSSEPCPGHEIVAVEVDDGSKSCADFVTAGDHAEAVGANRCFIAMPIHFDEDDKEIAWQGGIGLLEIEGDKVNEVVPAKLRESRLTAFPKPRFDGLKLAQELLRITEKDWEHLARLFCRAETAWLGFDVGKIHVSLEKKEGGTLNVELSVGAGPIRQIGTYCFKFGDITGFIVKGGDDRYTFVDKLGNLFWFRPSEWKFMLRVLSKVVACHLVFYVGTARIDFSKCPWQDGVDLEMDFNDGRDSYYEHHYSQKDLGMLTGKRRLKEKQVITSSEDS